MTAPAQIDTANVLTILGVLAAVWALISPASRLRLRFCMTWLDWAVGGAVFLLVHYLVFAPALEQLGLYYSLGPWRWGFNSSSAVYLLLLPVAFYFFWRTRSPTLVRRRIGVFRELIQNLHLTKRYDELVLLVEPQLPRLINLSRQQPLLARLVDCVDTPSINLDAILRGETPRARPLWRQRWSAKLRALRSWILKRDEVSIQAREVLLNLVTSPELTLHLAVAHPYFCLKLLEVDEAIRADFIEHYMDALLDAPGSRLYVELKNNQDLSRGSRLFLPRSNRLLHHFFSDAAAAQRNGLDRAIGEAICRRLDEDRKLAEKLNGSIGSYSDIGKFRCPINSGVTLFEIMVHEGIHQGLQDHMWLHYFGHFAEKILEQMPAAPDDKSLQEFSTPFHYLLNRLVNVATDWAEQCARIDDSEIPLGTRCADDFDRHFISKEATKVLGSMIEDIIPSQKLSMSSKVDLLEAVIDSHNRLQADSNLTDVASSLRNAVILGAAIPTESTYRIDLREVFKRVDHVKRDKAAQFKMVLHASLG